MMHWSAAVLIVLIIALLLTTTRKHTCFPFGPCKDGMVRKGLLVHAMIGFPSSSSMYTSVTPLLGMTMSLFSHVSMGLLGVGQVFWVYICMGEGMMLFMVCMVLSYAGMVHIGVGGEHCMRVTADTCIAVTPGHFPVVAISICHSIIVSYVTSSLCASTNRTGCSRGCGVDHVYWTGVVWIQGCATLCSNLNTICHHLVLRVGRHVFVSQFPLMC